MSDNGSISDGYHTFKELYDQRAHLWATILNANPDISWKSHKHEDGSMFDDMFIAGIDTPDGQYTFHIDDEWWDLFDIKEMPNAPHWDGHLPSDITRLLSLKERKD